MEATLALPLHPRCTTAQQQKEKCNKANHLLLSPRFFFSLHLHPSCLLRAPSARDANKALGRINLRGRGLQQWHCSCRPRRSCVHRRPGPRSGPRSLRRRSRSSCRRPAGPCLPRRCGSRCGLVASRRSRPISAGTAGTYIRTGHRLKRCPMTTTVLCVPLPKDGSGHTNHRWPRTLTPRMPERLGRSS